MWYTRGASHDIGIDVHDVGDRTRRLEPGMAFTIEPRIYIRKSALDGLPRTPANDARIAIVQAESGLRRLSASTPRTIDAIEAFLRKRPAASTAAR
jgi:Xaa-Pro aminopeptidase